MTCGQHTTSVTDPKTTRPDAAHIVTADGIPVVSVRALISRLQQVTNRDDIDHVCQVVADLTGTSSTVDRQAAEAEWQMAVIAHVFADPAAPDSAVDAEAARLDAAEDSQSSAPWRAAFTAQDITAPGRSEVGSPARRRPTSKPQQPGIER